MTNTYMVGSSLQEEQELSRSNATYLNVGYKTLKDPTLRAKYLVSLCCLPSCTAGDSQKAIDVFLKDSYLDHG